jgi:hypothetical protein
MSNFSLFSRIAGQEEGWSTDLSRRTLSHCLRHRGKARREGERLERMRTCKARLGNRLYLPLHKRFGRRTIPD